MLHAAAGCVSWDHYALWPPVASRSLCCTVYSGTTRQILCYLMPWGCWTRRSFHVPSTTATYCSTAYLMDWWVCSCSQFCCTSIVRYQTIRPPHLASATLVALASGLEASGLQDLHPGLPVTLAVRHGSIVAGHGLTPCVTVCGLTSLISGLPGCVIFWHQCSVVRYWWWWWWCNCITRNTLDCDQSNYSSRIVFPSYLLNLAKPKIAIFDPPTPKIPS